MRDITIDFSDELIDLLRVSHTDGCVSCTADRRAAIKDVIESMGVPHTEVGAIDARGFPVGFDYHPRPGDRIVVWAHTPPVDVTRADRLRPEPFAALRFVVDVNVGKLASLLRMLGQDTVYHNGIRDREIAELADVEQRVVLTRDTALLKRSKIVWGRLVRGIRPDDQLVEVVRFFHMPRPFALFSRCLVCNDLLAPVDKAVILHRLEPKTRKYFDEFKICAGCERIYWRGSHYDEMRVRLEKAGISIDS